MKIIRFLDTDGNIRHGVQESDATARPITGDLFGDFSVADGEVPVTKLLAPLVPSAIYGAGLNYQEVADKTGATPPPHTITFFKHANAVQDPGEPIEIPRAILDCQMADYEAELAVIIGRPCKNVSREQALDHVFGYTCANDVSGRDWQGDRVGGQWGKGKNFDTFLPLGPCIATRDEIADPQDLAITCHVNGELRQDSHTGGMITDVAGLIAWFSAGTTLPAGTVILTGTPYGVGANFDPPRPLQPGDTVEVAIAGIGTLRNPVTSDVAAAAS